MTREEWLNKLVARMRPIFGKLDGTIPEKIRVTCGFPSIKGTGLNQRRIGECWTDACSADGHFEIMISPTLSDPMRVAGVLAHELVHAAVGLPAGHKGPFKRLATSLGLEGKMTATTEGDAFKATVGPILDKLGAYPHAALNPRGANSGPKKQGTRLIKASCPDCGYTVRVTHKWLDMATPECPIDRVEMEVE